ncbi:hypothetical protein BRD17_00090 [Halobacteriales archaeon SW_7_68_16]|nr:MAG: hypothetical protein BRD17_00090 [Halobacteriales archaeon SW_7_68_16]
MEGEDRHPRVEDYMTDEVATVSPDATAAEVKRRIVESDGYSGFPVVERRRVEGFITSRDLLLTADDEPIFKLMTTDILVAHPAMKVTDAARVILRSGIQKLPVVDDAGNLIGIISNADVVRSQIERVTPEKVGKLRRTLENIHGVGIDEDRREIRLAALTPTQERVYADELDGRKYELERGLAEPLVVIEKRADDDLLLADGHHRVMAAEDLGLETMDAYVVVIDAPIELGMERTAREAGLDSLADVEVVDYAHHPLVEKTERFRETTRGGR